MRPRSLAAVVALALAIGCGGVAALYGPKVYQSPEYGTCAVAGVIIGGTIQATGHACLRVGLDGSSDASVDAAAD